MNSYFMVQPPTLYEPLFKGLNGITYEQLNTGLQERLRSTIGYVSGLENAIDMSVVHKEVQCLAKLYGGKITQDLVDAVNYMIRSDKMPEEMLAFKSTLTGIYPDDPGRLMFGVMAAIAIAKRPTQK
jgi:hypothetical protein